MKLLFTMFFIVQNRISVNRVIKRNLNINHVCSEGQKNYKRLLYDKYTDLVICNGPAGSGKTTLACNFALDKLVNKDIKKIVITRPTISIEEDLGYLPGNIDDKMLPFTTPIYDIFKESIQKTKLDYYIKEGIIEVCPLGFMQGRTFKNSVIIADEMQNSSPQQMFMLLTRIGENSKMIINGDLHQNKNNDNGLYDLVDKIELNELYLNNIGYIQLEKEDIHRHPIIETILQIYDK